MASPNHSPVREKPEVSPDDKDHFQEAEESLVNDDESLGSDANFGDDDTGPDGDNDQFNGLREVEKAAPDKDGMFEDALRALSVEQRYALAHPQEPFLVKPFRFLALPREIRDVIYEFAVVPKQFVTFVGKQDKKREHGDKGPLIYMQHPDEGDDDMVVKFYNCPWTVGEHDDTFTIAGSCGELETHNSRESYANLLEDMDHRVGPKAGVPGKVRYPRQPGLALFLVSHQLYEEASLAFYTKTIFQVLLNSPSNVFAFGLFIWDRPLSALRSIRSLFFVNDPAGSDPNLTYADSSNVEDVAVPALLTRLLPYLTGLRELEVVLHIDKYHPERCIWEQEDEDDYLIPYAERLLRLLPRKINGIDKLIIYVRELAPLVDPSKDPTARPLRLVELLRTGLLADSAHLGHFQILHGMLERNNNPDRCGSQYLKGGESEANSVKFYVSVDSGKGRTFITQGARGVWEVPGYKDLASFGKKVIWTGVRE